VNFLGTVAMWWLYFHIGQERAMRAIEHASDPGRMARVAFTYAHIPIVAGIVVSAVAAELVIAHPQELAGVGATASVLGGPALFLLGNIWFKKLTYRWMPLSHLVGLGLTAAAFLAHPWLSLLELSALSIAILIVVAVWERASLGGGLRETTGGPPEWPASRCSFSHHAGAGAPSGDVGAADMAEDVGHSC
jgi:low temperature requirement protein LtrA